MGPELPPWLDLTKPDFRASIRLLTPEEGGRSTPAKSGYRPSFGGLHPDYLKDGSVLFEGSDWASPGESHDISVWVVVKEDLTAAPEVGTKITLQEGSRVIAEGQITEVSPNFLDPLPPGFPGAGR